MDMLHFPFPQFYTLIFTNLYACRYKEISPQNILSGDIHECASCRFSGKQWMHFVYRIIQHSFRIGIVTGNISKEKLLGDAFSLGENIYLQYQFNKEKKEGPQSKLSYIALAIIPCSYLFIYKYCKPLQATCLQAALSLFCITVLKQPLLQYGEATFLIEMLPYLLESYFLLLRAFIYKNQRMKWNFFMHSSICGGITVSSLAKLVLSSNYMHLMNKLDRLLIAIFYAYLCLRNFTDGLIYEELMLKI